MYGFDERHYSAQQMLTTYRTGQGYGDAGSLIAGFTQLGTTVAGGIMSGIQQNKQYQHELSVLEQQEQLLQEQAQIAAAQGGVVAAGEAGKTERLKTLVFAGVGVVVFLGLAGLGVSYLRRD